MLTAIVRYSEGQIDDEGREVSTEPFAVEYDPWDGETREEAITYHGDVQFDWELISIEA